MVLPGPDACNPKLVLLAIVEFRTVTFIFADPLATANTPFALPETLAITVSLTMLSLTIMLVVCAEDDRTNTPLPTLCTTVTWSRTPDTSPVPLGVMTIPGLLFDTS